MNTYNRLLPELRLKHNFNQPSSWARNTALGTPSLVQLLEQIQPVPFQTILIGDCQDGLPFLFDLNQPENGPVLVTGDANCGKTYQLQVITESALQLYSPHQVQVAVISDHSGDWKAILSSAQRAKYCHGITTWHDRKSTNLVMDLSNLAEDRRNGRRRGSQVILIIDDLPGVMDWDYEAQVNLHWLLQYGPQSGIWPFVSVDASQAQEMHYWVDLFRTRLLGHIDSITLANDLAIYESNRCSQLNAPQEFTVYMGSDWVNFNLPVLDF
jgi:hypothetical protein